MKKPVKKKKRYSSAFTVKPTPYSLLHRKIRKEIAAIRKQLHTFAPDEYEHQRLYGAQQALLFATLTSVAAPSVAFGRNRDGTRRYK